MADSFIQMNPDGSGKKVRTQDRTVNAQVVHEQYTITTDETTGNTARVLNAQPASTDYGQVVRPLLPAKTQRTIYIAGFVPTATAETLIPSINSVLNFAAATAANTHTVTAGKTFRVMAITLTHWNSTNLANWGRIGLRVNTGGTATATSPLAAQLTATCTAAVNFVGEAAVMTFPEGLDLPAGASFCVTSTVSALTARIDFCIVGFEF